MKRVAFLPGLYSVLDGQTVCGDFNHDGNNELIFSDQRIGYGRWEVWECHPMNHYEMVYADSGGGPSVGIRTNEISPFAADYLDNDSMVDLVGMNGEYFPPESSPPHRPVSTVQEGPSQSSYPINLVWFDRLGVWFNIARHYITNLDQDGRKEIFLGWEGPRIYENTGDNQYSLVFHQTPWGGPFAFGDFDQDGRMEFVYPADSSRVVVWKCTGNNQYARVASLPFPIVGGNPLSNPHDCWSGHDIDGRPVFFVAFANPLTCTFYLYMWKATGINTYERTFIDQKTVYIPDGETTCRRSKCGDIDGDRIEEIVWATPLKLFVYKATGNNQFQQVWQWNQDHGGSENLTVSIYDMNKNGYNEIVVGGSGKTSIFEVEAVQVLSPNGGEVFQGDSHQLIRWQTFYPPRCDSLSLFYSIDNGRNYQSIVHGLQSTDTSYVWTVPNVNSDSCKIKIIVYGPGWQYDESDGLFSTTTTGVEEIASHPLAMTLGVKAYPNPARSLSVIRYSLPNDGKVSLQLYDISGRLVKTLVNENKNPGIYKISLNTKTLSAGVYFLSLETKEKKIIERLIIIK